MAGKSTVLRSTVAVALLAACGFYAPVASARVRHSFSACLAAHTSG